MAESAYITEPAGQYATAVLHHTDTHLLCHLASAHKNSKTQNYDTELLLPRDSVCVPVQPVVVVKSESELSAISFMGALRIPAIIEFSLCLLFAKLVSYTFLFWLPLYITKAGENQTELH
ncbi:glucose-6-phosphate exchanger SLC37A1 isoform X3 [Lates japonicus]|uniref:Glucose-6-phosphate exchanger SLC37A1 isoform X3 n=1 Tax=Lates japonicus TaxID=270547 RepID=A0AAD3QY74_LATJO|nr:glucose-6-phosphate exchanger SLC37A1 isoform X3 [Lates japonicus]